MWHVLAWLGIAVLVVVVLLVVVVVAANQATRDPSKFNRG